MLGTWRFLLAVFVVVAHLRGPWWPGGFAVFSFYVISGYLMTLVMNNSYSFTREGFQKFWLNRFLRLYPSYWAAALLSLSLIALIPPDFMQAWNPKLRFPDSLYEIISNISIAGLIHLPDKDIVLTLPIVNEIRIPANPASLVPPAWALAIELFYYLLISAWFGKKIGRSLLLLVLGLGYILVVSYFSSGGERFFLRYFFVAGAALPFGLGATLFHLQAWAKTKFPSSTRSFSFRLLFFSFSLYTACLVSGIYVSEPLDYLIYVNVMASGLLLIALTNLNGVPAAVRQVDAFLGDLSYPIYLMHWQAGMLVAWIISTTQKSTSLFISALLLVILLSVIDRYAISKPIGLLRDRIKGWRGNALRSTT